MIKKLAVSLSVALACLVISASVFAGDVQAPLKIAVIDLQKIMKKSSQVAAINSQLEKQFKPKQQNILVSRKTLQEEVEKLNRNSAVMSDSDRTKLQNKIIAERANLQSAEISFQQELNSAQGQETQKFMRKLKEQVTQVAHNGNYTMIMVKQGIPYVDDKLDVTDAVLNMLEKK
jgi:outer membrane protein